MAYDLQEQEQLASIKAWWAKYGTFVLSVVTIVLLAAAAYNGWRWYSARESALASEKYEQLLGVVGKDSAKAREIAGSIIEQHGRTVFASLAALQAAKLNHDAGDLSAASAQLRWVVDQSGRPEFAMLARVRLAGVLLDAKQHDEALKVLASGPVPAGQATLFADRRGDVLAAKGDVAQARAAYREALEKADAQHPLRALIQLKLDALPAS